MMMVTLKFDSEDAAKADSVVGKYWFTGDSESPGSWRGDVCLPNVTVSNGIDTIPGWFITIGNVDSASPIVAMAYTMPDGYMASPGFA